MSAKIYRLADGAEGLFIKNERFNTTSVSFNFYLPLAADTAAAYALLPFILTTCGEKYPDFSVLNYKLAKLYGADLTVTTSMQGACRVLSVSVSGIKDEFALEGEALSAEYAAL